MIAVLGRRRAQRPRAARRMARHCVLDPARRSTPLKGLRIRRRLCDLRQCECGGGPPSWWINPVIFCFESTVTVPVVEDG